MRIATIDLGTNTCHLLINEASTSSNKKVYAETNPVKLGEAGITENFISEDAIKRAVIIINKYVNTCKAYKVEKIGFCIIFYHITVGWHLCVYKCNASYIQFPRFRETSCIQHNDEHNVVVRNQPLY